MRKLLAVIAAAVVASLGLAVPSGASDNHVSASHKVDGTCDVVITFTNHTEQYTYDADVRVDGEAGTPDDEMPAQHDHGVKPGQEIDSGPFAGETFGLRYQPVLLEPGETVEETVSFDEESGEHTVEYRVWRGPENNEYLPWTSVEVDCGEPADEEEDEGDEDEEEEGDDEITVPSEIDTGR
ncbi:MAG: hypothetical protein ACOC9B_04985 [Chloroflexota bacterium]